MRVWSLVVVILVLFICISCKGNSEILDSRKLLAKETDTFVGLYKVAYDKVSSLQNAQHPCTKGHKAGEAALFHAVLSSLHKSYTNYKNSVQQKMGATINKDGKCKNLYSSVERLSKPFATSGNLAQCGKLEAVKAKELFYLQHPQEIAQSVNRFRQEMEQE